MLPRLPALRLRRALTAALGYARKGWRVLPLHWIEADGRCSCIAMRGRSVCPASAGKHPIEKTGKDHEAATTIEFVIRQWWRRYPLANVAIVTGIYSNLIVVDIDPKNGGLESLAQLQADRPFPPTETVHTPSGGFHYYFTHPGLCQIVSTKGALPGVDIQADGAFVVAPPSIVGKGAYSWV